MLDEAERKKLLESATASAHLHLSHDSHDSPSASQDDLVAQYNKYMSAASAAASGSAEVNAARTLDSLIGNSQGYTLEVLDQRVSDKFERTDSETIKARYGVDSYQYMPSSLVVDSGKGPSSYIVSGNAGNGSSEYYTNNGSQSQTQANLRASGSFKSISSATETRNANANNNNSSSNIFGSYAGADSNYGNLTMPGMASPVGNQTPVSMQKMMHSYGSASVYEQES